MLEAFPKPKCQYHYALGAEVKRLRNHKAMRGQLEGPRGAN